MENLIKKAKNKNQLYKIPRLYIEDTVKNPKIKRIKQYPHLSPNNIDILINKLFG